MIKLIIFLVTCQIIIANDQDQGQIQNVFQNITQNCPAFEMEVCNKNINYMSNSIKTLAEYKNSLIELNVNDPFKESKAIIQNIKLLIYKKLDMLRQIEDL